MSRVSVQVNGASRSGSGSFSPRAREYFFHRSDVTGGSFEDLKDGDTVEFDVGESPKGPRAERIRKK